VTIEDRNIRIDRSSFDAVIFDMDGVITSTASVHMAAWKELFDDLLRGETDDPAGSYQPFTQEDYRRYVDGKAREDGIRSFLSARGIDVPEGSADDSPGVRTIHGLAALKDSYFQKRLEQDGATAFPGAITLIGRLHEAGIGTAVISASRNAERVLSSAGVLDLFAVRVDGVTAAELGLPGKPDPAVFLEAARRLGVVPDRAVVLEDAQAGVRAASQGGFGMVVGVDRGGAEQGLLEQGADVVVTDLADIQVG
jgi:alpha,alpha-trehalase